ncbi:MAG: sigma factor-like helix-turn-helix DNA-binding protein [Candidatus Kerfeldbacteria bacterium]
MENQNSILDKVISSKKTLDIEQFNPVEVVSSLLKDLTSREEDVLRRRHGLLGKEKETLENIGDTYKVTRERIRQIEKTAIVKIKKNKSFVNISAPIERTSFSVLEQHGGVMSEDSLLDELLQVSGNNLTNRQNILFIISELLDSKFKKIKEDETFRESWQIVHAPIHLLKDTLNFLYEFIEENKKPLTVDDVIRKFKESEFYSKNSDQFTDEVIISYLEISPKISQNPFGEYGLTSWGSVVPKRMNDKIYLVLKRQNKPMHFNEITEKINEIKFDERKAYPPTVHNELILNKKYVLVGRGIYALKEWGYEPGVVSNVLQEILKKEEKPLTREELVKSVLERRIVKKNTIHLALTNREKFKKLSDDTYTLVE